MLTRRVGYPLASAVVQHAKVQGVTHHAPTADDVVREEVGYASGLRFAQPRANPPYEAIHSANSRHGSSVQCPDAAPEGEGNTNISGKPTSRGCRPSAIPLDGLP